MTGTGVSVELSGFVTVSGNFGFEKSGGGIRAAASGVSAKLSAGPVEVGVSNGTLGLVLNADGTKALEASGTFAFSGADFVRITAQEARFKLNETTTDYSLLNETIAIGGASVTLTAAPNESQLTVTNAAVEIDDFFHVRGNFAFKKFTAALTLAGLNPPAERVDVELLTVGASGVEAFVGINGPVGAPGAIGFAVADVNFALALASVKDPVPPPAESEPKDLRNWTAVKAQAGRASFIGVDGLRIEATGLEIALNQAGGSKQVKDEQGAIENPPNTTVVDWAAQPIAVNTGGGNSILLDLDGDDGALEKVVGQASINVLGFGVVSGSWAFSKSETADGMRLTAAVTDATAFVGAGGGTANEMGIKLSEGRMGLVAMKTTGAAQTKFALAGSGRASLVGIPGVTLTGTLAVQVNRTGAVVDEVLPTPGGDVQIAIPDVGDVTQVAGSELTLKLGGLIEVSGDFVFMETGSGQNTKVLIGAQHLTAFLGYEGKGLQLVKGRLGVVMIEKADGTGGYAVQGGGSITTAGIGVTLMGDVDVRVNMTGAAVDETVPMEGDDIRILFLNGDEVEEVTPRNFDIPLDGEIRDWVAGSAQTVADLRESLEVTFDTSNNPIYNSVLAQPIPGLGASLDTMLELSPILDVGKYTLHYLHPALHPGEPLPVDDPIPPGVYELGKGPTLRGLLDYLKANWRSIITMTLTDRGFDLGVNYSPSYEKEFPYVGDVFNFTPAQNGLLIC